MKKVIAILVLALVAGTSFAQKNMTLHQNTGSDYMVGTMGVDSITFGDFNTPGNMAFSTYLESDSVEMEHHGKVTWESFYKTDAGIIAGGFEVVHYDMAFDEANPANIAFDGLVDLTTTSTFEPGRDDPTHCVHSSLGITTGDWYTTLDSTYHLDGNGDVIDTVYTTSYDSVPSAIQYATLTSAAGNTVAYGNGYKSVAQFTYRGVTGPVDVYFEYLGLGNNDAYAIIEGNFQFEPGASSSDPWYCGSSPKKMVFVGLHLKFHCTSVLDCWQ